MSRGGGRRRGSGRGGDRGAGARRSRRGGRGVRAFLAFDLPQDVKHVLIGEMDRLRRRLPPARWVRPEGLHVTVKFLGEVPVPRLERLERGLAERLGELAPVEIRLAGAGFFPSPSQARVAWVGGEAPGARAVVEEVESIAGMLGFPRERRAWHLHVTLARLDTPWPRYAAEELLAWGEDLALPGFLCRELVCFESHLRPGGAVYTPRRRVPLGGGE